MAVDDDEEWRSILATNLRRKNFLVDEASSIEEARQRLDNDFYHFMTLDICFDGSDTTDVSGMDFLRQSWPQKRWQAVKVIMLSAYGTTEQASESFADLDVVDFIDKHKFGHREFDYRKFVAQLSDKLLPKLKLNPSLEIHWQGLEAAPAAVVGLKVDGQAVRRDDGGKPWRMRVAEEFEDLICRLFHKADSVLLRPLAGGHSRTGILMAEPSFAGKGSGSPRIVKYGDAEEIHEEAENYRQYVADFIGGGRAPRIEAERRTWLLGGICYSLAGVGSSSFETWRSFFARAGLDEIRASLDHLFKETCERWYANLGSLGPVNLRDEYAGYLSLDEEILVSAFEKLPSVQAAPKKGKGWVTFNALEGRRAFRDAIDAGWHRPFGCTTHRCHTHGDLNADNILVDSHGATWLIDFRRTGPGHILRDFAQLDATVRFQLLSSKEIDLAGRLEIEEALLDSDELADLGALEERVSHLGEEAVKVVGVCAHIRSLARMQMERYGGNVTEYLAASLYLGLSWTRFVSAPRVTREHAFLSAALCAEKLHL